MDQELEKLHKKAEKYIDRIKVFVHTVAPQIDGYKKDYREYFKDVITASGVFAALTQALLASNLPKVASLAVVGFFLLIIAIVLAFLGFRKGLVVGAKYVLSVKKIQRKMVDFSGIATQFTRAEITPEAYKIKQDEFERSYPDFRNNEDMDEFNTYENQLLQEIAESPFLPPSIISVFFVGGIILVALSVLIPQVLFLCNV